MTKLCLCLTAPTIARNLEVLNAYKGRIDLAELRVDCLLPEEQFHIRRFPALAGIPTILTVRRKSDGGNFTDGEGSRFVLLAKGLGFADEDRSLNFAYIDMEHDMQAPSLEEAARTFGTRIIRSFHDYSGVPNNVDEIVRTLPHHANEIPKIAVNPKSFADCVKIFKSAQYLEPFSHILIGMGEFGACTRILASKIGSAIAYTTPFEKDFPQAGFGQVDPESLISVYKSKSINKDTRIFGIVGRPLFGSRSPLIHNTAFQHECVNAVYLPFPCDDLNVFMDFAEFLPLDGFSVTVPFKERILPLLDEIDTCASKIGAVNTVVRKNSKWLGSNTDALGFSLAIQDFLKVKSLKGIKTTLVGSGGAARAIAYELARQKAKVCIVNRTPVHALSLARKYNFPWGGFDANGLDLISRHSDLIIQATSAGMEPETDNDPLSFYEFQGHEALMDIVYKPLETKMLKRAKSAGCRTLNGISMLNKQGEFQSKEFFLALNEQNQE